MFHRYRRTASPALLASLVLALAVPSIAAPAHAATPGPKVSLKCVTVPAKSTGTCWTWGSSFVPGETVHLTYRIVYLTVPKQKGKHPQKVYHAKAKANGSGSFAVPALQFRVPRRHDTYAVYVTGVGAQQDKGSTSTASIGR